MDITKLGLVSYIWILLGIFSLILLVYQLLTKSTLSKIPLDKINKFQEKVFLGKKSFSLELKNKKSRKLTILHREVNVNELKGLFSGIGIEVS